MLKFNKIISLLLLFTLQIQVFSQFSDLPIQNQKDYNVLIKKIQRNYKCSRWFSKKDTRLIVIFKLHTVASISKEEFIDGSFLKKLEYSYISVYKQKIKVNNRDFRRRKPIPKSYTTINSKEKIVATFPYEYMKFMQPQKFAKKYYEKILKTSYGNISYEEYCEIHESITSIFKTEQKALRNYIWDKGNLFIFQLREYDTYFIINEQLEIFVFFNESDEGYRYKVLPIKEFIDMYWDLFSKEIGGRLTD